VYFGELFSKEAIGGLDISGLWKKQSVKKRGKARDHRELRRCISAFLCRREEGETREGSHEREKTKQL